MQQIMSNLVVHEPPPDNGNDSAGYLKFATGHPNPAFKEEDYEQLPEDHRDERTANSTQQGWKKARTYLHKRLIYTGVAVAVVGILAFIAFVLVIWTIVRVNNIYDGATDEKGPSIVVDFIQNGSCGCGTSDKSYEIVFHTKRGLGTNIEYSFLNGDTTGNKCVQEALDFYIFRSDLIANWQPSSKIRNVSQRNSLFPNPPVQHYGWVRFANTLDTNETRVARFAHKTQSVEHEVTSEVSKIYSSFIEKQGRVERVMTSQNGDKRRAIVKYTICKEGQQVAFILFDGRFSTKENWFSPERVSDSSWTDLNGSLTFNYFTLKGGGYQDFLIRYNASSCVDFGWTSVLNKEESCHYKKNLAAYPAILYADTPEALSRSANDSPGNHVNNGFYNAVTMGLSTEVQIAEQINMPISPQKPTRN